MRGMGKRWPGMLPGHARC